jgi:hypothetical protein
LDLRRCRSLLSVTGCAAASGAEGKILTAARQQVGNILKDVAGFFTIALYLQLMVPTVTTATAITVAVL